MTGREMTTRPDGDRHREVQRERQRAYRRRLREKGVRELRLRLSPEHHDRVREVADALEAGQLRDEPPAGLGPDGARWRAADIVRLARSRVGLALIGAGCALGVLGGAFASFEVQTGNLRSAHALVPDLKREVTRLTATNDALRGDVGRARDAARRATEDLTAIRSALTTLNLDIGTLRQDVTTLTGQSRATSRAGPRLVPQHAAESRMFGPPLIEAVELRPTLVAYQFQLGDTLETVARRFGVSVDDITAINDRLRPSPWRLGDTIVVPARHAARSAAE